MKCSRCECEINVGGKTYWQLPKDSPDAKVRGWTELCDTCHDVWLYNTGNGGIAMENAEATPHLEMVNHPAHYNAGKFEVIDVIEDWKLGFSDGNAVKYIGRARHKGKLLEDAKKARWYADRFVQECGGDTWNPEDRDAGEPTGLNPMQQQVFEFIDLIGHPVSEYPALWPDDQARKRARDLIESECKELLAGIDNNDWTEIVDGGVDLIYVVLYLFCITNLDITPFFNEVQRTNLAKRGGPVDPETGKQLKPPGWKPPDIDGMLQKLRDRALRETGLKR